MSATPGTLQKRAPKLGEDTEAVLRGCGLSEAELDLLTKNKRQKKDPHQKGAGPFFGGWLSELGI